MTYGKLSPPFGFLRVKILEFLSALLNTRYQSVVDAFWKTEPNVFETLLVRIATTLFTVTPRTHVR